MYMWYRHTVTPAPPYNKCLYMVRTRPAYGGAYIHPPWFPLMGAETGYPGVMAPPHTCSQTQQQERAVLSDLCVCLSKSSQTTLHVREAMPPWTLNLALP